MDLIPIVNANRFHVQFHINLVAAVFLVPFALLDTSAMKRGCLPVMPARLAHAEISLGNPVAPAVRTACRELILQYQEVQFALLAQQAHTVHWSVNHPVRLAQLEPSAQILGGLQFHLAQRAPKELTLSLVKAVAQRVRLDLSARISVNRRVHRVPLEHTDQLQKPFQIVRACSARLECLHFQVSQLADGHWRL